jgi:hypothetical protein
VRSTVQRLPFGLLRILLPVIPIHVWVLVKPGPDVIPRAGEFMQRRLWRAAMPGDL